MTQKTTFVKVISILFIISGIYQLITHFVSFSDNAGYGAAGVAYTIVGIVYLAVQVAAGILGIQKKDNPDLCTKLAVFIMAMVVVEGVLSFLVVGAIAEAAGAANLGGIAGFVTSVISVIFGLILPALYLLAIRISARNAARSPQISG